MSTLTWLHLSDLHFRDTEASVAGDQNVVLRALLQDVKERIRQDGLVPDFIAVTGDVAFSGKSKQYKRAWRFFDELLTATSLPRDRLFVVPGNHDVDRSLITSGAQAIGDSLTDRTQANTVLDTPADRRLMFARFKGYAAFVKTCLPHLPFDEKNFYYVRLLDLSGQSAAGDGPRIALLGLNSAWLAASDEDKTKELLLGERQTRAALDAAEAAGAHLKIALLHHPFDWLREFDRRDSEAMLYDNCDFILHGHLHHAGLMSLQGPDTAAMVIAAGACYKAREFPNMVNWVRLDLAAGSGTVWLRRYADERGGFWAKDTLTYRNVPDGWYRFRFAGQDGGVAVVGDQNAVITGQAGRDVAVSHGGAPVPATLVATDGYDLRVVRDLLLAAFSAAELRRLFLYTGKAGLQPLVREFGPSDGLAAMADKTIEYCQVHRLLPDLLEEVQRANRRQYDRFAGRLEG
jgi:predicted phosphodiesterase